MINQVTLIGRIVETPILKNYEGEFSVTTLTLAVSRPFKNMEGNYDTDFIRISLWNKIAKNTCEYTQKGDVVAVKGRLQMKETEVSFGNEKKKINVLEVIGERVIFIQSNQKKEVLSGISEEEQEN